MLKPILGLAVAAALVPAVSIAATFTVTNTASSGAGSLAQAITDANATDNSDTISFNIAGGGIKTIGGVLPAITMPLTIDGYTQAGAVGNTTSTGATNAKLMVVLDGSSVSSGSAVLRVNSSAVTIRGLVIGGMKSNVAGIEFAVGTTGGSVKGCFIGTDAAGAADASAGLGIVVRGTADIGSDQYIDRNLVSGNGGAGIVLRGPSSFVRTNLIGTNAAGDPVLPNARGVQIAGSAASGNKLGDFGLIAPNVIAGNSGDGILLSADAGAGNTFDLNQVHDNGGLSIDLGGDGFTPNDATDSDAGPNNLLNSPEIGLARINGKSLTAHVVLRVPAGNYRLAYYVGASPGTNGSGEMASQLNGVSVSTGTPPYRLKISATLDSEPADSLWLSAVLTSIADGSSSEVSRATEAVQAGSELTVTNTNDSGNGSLRAAIATASADAAPNTIVFAIPGSGPHAIALQSPLEVTTNPLLVDGYTQAGALVNSLQQGVNAKPGIELDGSAIASGPVFVSSGAPVILRGLAVVAGPDDGILLDKAQGSTVEGCFAGVSPDNEPGPGNGEFGITDFQSGGVRLGDAFVGARNLIGDNGLGGVLLRGADARVFNNIVGTVAHPNDGPGIEANGDSSTIGDESADFFNSIVGNSGDGIFVDVASSGNDIRGNVTKGNNGLGINLDSGLAAVTPNDTNDTDSGANGLQNFPVLSAATAEVDLLTIEGTLDVPVARVNSSYRIRFYRTATCDPSGHGEGDEMLGAADVFIGPDESFAVYLPVTATNASVTATVTDPETGNTSEFSNCVAIAIGTPVCGDASGDFKILAGDALSVLKAAVGTTSCSSCVCDVNTSGSTTANDALLVLKKAVGQSVTLTCPACS